MTAQTLIRLATGPWSAPVLAALGGAVLALFGLALHTLAARTSAAQRHALLLATAVGLVVLPLLQLAGPRWGFAELSVAAPARPAPAGAPAGGGARPGTPPASSLGATASAAAAGGPGPAAAVATVYLAGVVAVLLPLVVGALRMAWLVRRARPFAREVGRDGALPDTPGVRILGTGAVRVPLAWGWRRPVILLPVEARDWPAAMRRDAVVHELGHLERRDPVAQTVARVAVALHWFDPLAWAVHRRLVLEAERACDDRVLAAGADSADYAERLLRIAADARQAALRRLPAVAMARSSQLATRVESLLEATRRRVVRLGRTRLAATAGLMLLPAVLAGAVRLEARSVAPDPSSGWGRDAAGGWRWKAGDGSSRDGTSRDGTDADRSPLYAAIRAGDADTVALLLAGGADPNARWSGDGTPLIVAVRRGERDIVDVLLAHGARPDVGVAGDGNALIVAAARGDLASLERFFGTGVDIDRGVPGDGNPLIAAAAAGEVDALRWLAAHGADVEAVVPGDENALISAAANGRLEAVRVLLSLGADVNARLRAQSWRHGRPKPEIRTALGMARRNGHAEVVDLLIAHGARE